MKFYIICDDDAGEIAGCELSLEAAVQEARSLTHRFTISEVDAALTADTLRRILGQRGGYAKSYKTVHTE